MLVKTCKAIASPNELGFSQLLELVPVSCHARASASKLGLLVLVSWAY